MRSSTLHFTSASIFWFSKTRAASFTPTNILKRDTAFSARLWRVAPLEVRHG